MKQEDLKNAILQIAELYGLKLNIQALIESNVGFSRLVEIISYRMFLNSFDSRSCSDEHFKAYKFIYNYAKELDEKGEVNFK